MADEKKNKESSLPPTVTVECSRKKVGGDIEIDERDVYRGNYLACRNGRRICSGDIVRRVSYKICLLRCDHNCESFKIFKDDHPDLFQQTKYFRKYYRRPKK